MLFPDRVFVLCVQEAIVLVHGQIVRYEELQEQLQMELLVDPVSRRMAEPLQGYSQNRKSTLMKRAYRNRY